LVDALRQLPGEGVSQRELLAVFHTLDQFVERKSVAEYRRGA